MINLKKENRCFFIGDIHGDFDGLIKELNNKGVTDKDYLIFLGDLINRGNQNLEVLNFLKIRKSKNKEKTIILFGNHDYFFCNYFYEKSKVNESFVKKFCGWTSSVEKKVIYSYAKWLYNNCQYYEEILFDNKKIGAVHAQVPEDDWEILVEDLEFCLSDILCSFSRYNAFKNNEKVNKIKNIDLVVSGHVPVKDVFVIENSVFIDTGSYFIDYIEGIKGNITIIEIRDILSLLK